MSDAEVELLVERRVTERMEQALAEMRSVTSAALAQVLVLANRNRNVAEHKVSITYDESDRITDMTITPVYRS